MACIIDGKSLSKEVRQRVASKIAELGISPVLAVIFVGENEASRIYVRNKKKAASEVGIDCRVYELPQESEQKEVVELVDKLNRDKEVNGIIVQLPLPASMDAKEIISFISPEKDVDGLGIYNTGMLAMGDPNIVAATPKGILCMLKSVCENLSGKNAVIIGRSNIVGRPMSALLLNNDCTVTVAHSKTRNIKEITQHADIVIAACGCPKMIKKDWIKEGAVVIDVGINRVDDKICGDVDFEDVEEKASYISPVPGGVGPMTVAMLIDNTFIAAVRQLGK